MNINQYNNISFGQLVSTPLLLRAGSGMINFGDAKLLNQEIGREYSGKISFYKRAMNIAAKVSENNETLSKIFEELRTKPKKELETYIRYYTNKLGEKIDIEI